jgi:hypothetical protein
MSSERLGVGTEIGEGGLAGCFRVEDAYLAPFSMRTVPQEAISSRT